MKSAKIALALILLGGTAGFAQAALDADGDGLVTLEEILAVYPDASADDFATADIDSSGALDEDEMAIALESGLIPAAE